VRGDRDGSFQAVAGEFKVSFLDPLPPAFAKGKLDPTYGELLGPKPDSIQ
jgi:hypothetical protein